MRDYASHDRDEVLADPARLGHVKYLFVTAIEGCIDAAQHVCASEGYGAPDTNADAMLALGRHGLLEDDEATAMARAVRFRNVLVHGYAAVDDRRVVGFLDDLGRLDGFVSSLAGLIA